MAPRAGQTPQLPSPGAHPRLPNPPLFLGPPHTGDPGRASEGFHPTLAHSHAQLARLGPMPGCRPDSCHQRPPCQLRPPRGWRGTDHVSPCLQQTFRRFTRVAENDATSRTVPCHVPGDLPTPGGPLRLAECKGRHLGWTPAPSPALHLEPEPCPRAGARAGCLWAGRPLAGPLGSQSPAGTRFGAPRTSELMRVECETSFGRCRGQPTPTHRPFAPCYGPSTPGGGHLPDRRPGLSSMAPPGRPTLLLAPRLDTPTS